MAMRVSFEMMIMATEGTAILECQDGIISRYQRTLGTGPLRLCMPYLWLRRTGKRLCLNALMLDHVSEQFEARWQIIQ